jgi:hypothetical protein
MIRFISMKTALSTLAHSSALASGLVASGLALALSLGGCSGEAQTHPIEPNLPLPTPAPPTSAATASAPAAPPLRAEAGHNLAIMAAACWFGGVWGDAEGDSPETRAQASEARCHDVVRRVYGHDDTTRYEQLRALEGDIVADIAAKVETLAREDSDDAPRSQALADLVKAVAAAQRESLFARRAALRVRRDLDREPDNLSKDEAAAVAPLKDIRMVTALINFNEVDLQHDAHALGVLAALDRMDISRGLPRHMKIYAVGGINHVLFGAAPPPVTDDVNQPLKRGLWLVYLTDVAKAAAHPVPIAAKTPKQREPLAWTGVLEGYGDKLRTDIDQLVHDTRLHHVIEVVIQRLDVEYKAEVNALTGPPAEKVPRPGATPAPKASH